MKKLKIKCFKKKKGFTLPPFGERNCGGYSTTSSGPGGPGGPCSPCNMTFLRHLTVHIHQNIQHHEKAFSLFLISYFFASFIKGEYILPNT